MKLKEIRILKNIKNVYFFKRNVLELLNVVANRGQNTSKLHHLFVIMYTDNEVCRAENPNAE